MWKCELGKFVEIANFMNMNITAGRVVYSYRVSNSQLRYPHSFFSLDPISSALFYFPALFYFFRLILSIHFSPPTSEAPGATLRGRYQIGRSAAKSSVHHDIIFAHKPSSAKSQPLISTVISHHHQPILSSFFHDRSYVTVTAECHGSRRLKVCINSASVQPRS